MKKSIKIFVLILSAFLFLQSNYIVYSEENSSNVSPVVSSEKPVYKNKNLKPEPKSQPAKIDSATPKTSSNVPVTPPDPVQVPQVQQAKAETSPLPQPVPSTATSTTAKKEVSKKSAPKLEVASNESNELPSDAEQIENNHSIEDESNVSAETENTNDIVLPDVSFEEINAVETISQLTPDKKNNNMIKSIVSLVLVLVGVVVILLVIFSNRKIPKNYEPNKFGRNTKSKNKNTTNRYYKKKYY